MVQKGWLVGITLMQLQKRVIMHFENVTPTDEEKALAQRIAGTVTIKLADQSIPACKAIKIKS